MDEWVDWTKNNKHKASITASHHRPSPFLPRTYSTPNRWVKLKPEYGEETQDFDLVLLGGIYGEGMYTGCVFHM